MPFRGRGNRMIVGAGRPKRPMDWECGDLSASVGDGVKLCKWLIPPSELRDRYTDPTLMASMVWGGMSTSDPTVDTTGGFGIIVWSAASDVDPTGDECPGPLTQCDADWAYTFYGPFTPTPGRVSLYCNTELDRRSSAKRRIGNDKGILLVAETFETPGIAFHFHVRCLIKE